MLTVDHSYIQAKAERYRNMCMEDWVNYCGESNNFVNMINCSHIKSSAKVKFEVMW